MGYINFRIEKMKNTNAIFMMRSHNQRVDFCDNADPSRRFLNKQIMQCHPDYNEFYRMRIEEAGLTGKRSPRKDAVRILDLEFRVSAEEMENNPRFDLDEFCEKIKGWVCENFGAENVADMVLHMDEGYGMQDGVMKFAPHIHAVVVPITKDNRLSASEYIGKPQKLIGLQTSVAKVVEPLGLKRGMEKSVATHTEMKDFYGWVHAARVVELPEPKRGETAQQYALRITPKLQERQAQHLGDRLALERERDEALTRVRQLEGGSRKGESDLKRAQEELKKKERELAEKEKQLDADRGTLQQWLDVLRGLRSMSEDDREAFVDIADRALQAGREAREAEAAAALGKGKN